MPVTQDEFAGHVREVLASLYDPVTLANQRFAGMMPGQSGATLRELLLAAIEKLRPGPQVDPKARAWRPYRILKLRYVESRDAAEVQRELAISKSQYYREHESALASVVALLWQDRQAEEGHAQPEGSAPNWEGARHAVPLCGEGHPQTLDDVRPATSQTRRGWRWNAVAGGALAVVVALAVLALAHKAAPPATVARSGDAGVAAASRIASLTKPVSATLSIYAGAGQPGHLNGAAAQAMFAGAFGLGVAPNGDVFVADTGNNRVRRIISSGFVLDAAGSGVQGYRDGPVADAQFSVPNAVAVGPDGTIYVGDAGNTRIRAISPAGIVSTLAGSGAYGYIDDFGAAAQFSTTGAVISDSAGNVYVPDQGNNVVRKVTPDGAVTTYAGSGVRGHLDGSLSTAQFNGPQRGGGVDGAGNVYVLDTDDWRIRKISPEGMVTTVAGTGEYGYRDGPASQALFSDNILGLIVDAGGTLYVMDAGNRRVRVIMPDASVSTLYEFVDPGQTPGNIKVDRTGNLYLSDRQHNRIYKLTVRRGG